MSFKLKLSTSLSLADRFGLQIPTFTGLYGDTAPDLSAFSSYLFSIKLSKTATDKP